MHSFMTEKCSQVLRKALLVVNYINTSNFFPSNKPIKDKLRSTMCLSDCVDFLGIWSSSL